MILTSLRAYERQPVLKQDCAISRLLWQGAGISDILWFYESDQHLG